MLKKYYLYSGNGLGRFPLLSVTSERQIEKRLKDRAKAMGGLALKWTSPAFAGVPDRIVFLPGGRILFVELKAPGKKPTPLQVKVAQTLIALGAEVYLVDSKEGVDALLA